MEDGAVELPEWGRSSCPESGKTSQRNWHLKERIFPGKKYEMPGINKFQLILKNKHYRSTLKSFPEYQYTDHTEDLFRTLSHPSEVLGGLLPQQSPFYSI